MIKVFTREIGRELDNYKKSAIIVELHCDQNDDLKIASTYIRYCSRSRNPTELYSSMGVPKLLEMK